MKLLYGGETIIWCFEACVVRMKGEGGTGRKGGDTYSVSALEGVEVPVFVGFAWYIEDFFWKLELFGGLVVLMERSACTSLSGE